MRLIRETELLGGSVSSTIDRNAITLKSVFLKENLPYFVTALGDVLAKTSFRPHELTEEAGHYAKVQAENAAQDPYFLASEAVHASAFHTGLGNQLYADASNPVTLEQVKNFASSVYTKSNIAIVGSGIVEADLAKFLGESAFSSLPTGAVVKDNASGSFSGETRIKFSGNNVVTLAFPVSAPSSAYKVLAAGLGGSPSAYFSTGLSPLGIISSENNVFTKSEFVDYGDSGLFTITISGTETSAVSATAKGAVKALQSFTSDLLSKAIAQAEFADALAAEEKHEFLTANSLIGSPLATVNSKTTLEEVKKAVSSLTKPNLAVVGKIHELPYLSDLI